MENDEFDYTLIAARVPVAIRRRVTNPADGSGRMAMCYGSGEREIEGVKVWFATTVSGDIQVTFKRGDDHEKHSYLLTMNDFILAAFGIDKDTAP